MKTIKLILNYTVIIILIATAIVNTSNQLESLKKAKEENKNLEAEIYRLTESNKNLERQISYATSSAYLERQAREKFGVGGTNDYWLKLTAENKKLDLYPEVTRDKNLPIIQQWIRLFTR